MYINGSEAQVGTQAVFDSDVPRQLTIFAGDYEVQKFPNATFINTKLSDKQAVVFDEVVRYIRQFYTDILRIPYNQHITFLKHQPVEKFNEGRSWGFVNFPTVAVAGVGFEEQVSDTAIRDVGSFSFYAHELGHYYFGTVLRPNSELAPFFMESMTEYLSIKATEYRYGKSYTKNYIAEKRKILKDKKVIPINRVTTAETIIRDYYQYSYGPLLLMGLESIIGEKKTYSLLRRVLSQDGQRTDYKFLKKSALDSGISLQDWQRFENTFIQIETASDIFAKLPTTTE